MTLKQIIIMALNNINEDIDELTVEEYRESIVRSINEAYMDICARRYQPRKLSAVKVPEDGNVAVNTLPDDYVQPCGITTGKGMPLTFSPRGRSLKVYGYTGTAVLEYVYLPGRMYLDSEKPILPEHNHYCLADYAAWRQLMTGSPARQARGAMFYDSYLKAANRVNRQGHERPALTGKFGRGF